MSRSMERSIVSGLFFQVGVWFKSREVGGIAETFGRGPVFGRGL